MSWYYYAAVKPINDNNHDEDLTTHLTCTIQ